MRQLRFLHAGSVAALVLHASACAHAPVDAEDLRYRQADFELRFVEFRSQCLARGGRILIDARSKVGRDGVPSRGSRYYCA